MDCKRFLDLCVQMADGAWDQGIAKAVEVHAAACPVCARRLAEAREVRRAIQALPRIGAPAELWSGIARRIEAEAVRRRVAAARQRQLVGALAPLAAAAVVLLAVFLVVPAPQTDSPTLPVGPAIGPWASPATPPAVDVSALVIEHTQLANEPFVGGDDLVMVECALRTGLINE